MVVELAAIDQAGVLLGSARTDVLVDSGADMTMLHAGLATQLGLDVTTMQQDTMQGVGGSTTTFLPATPIFVQLCGRWVRIPVAFEHGRQPNLLGRAGAFDALIFAFVHGQHVMLAGNP
jgi:hypothetical protein